MRLSEWQNKIMNNAEIGCEDCGNVLSQDHIAGVKRRILNGRSESMHRGYPMAGDTFCEACFSITSAPLFGEI